MTPPNPSGRQPDGPTCPWCGSARVERIGQFGPQLMTAQYQCLDCGSPFGRIRQRGPNPAGRTER